MSIEREIVKKLFESKHLDEKTYTIGDTQYWKRGGKTYKWTQSGGRQECSEDEYYKALSGGTSGNDVVKKTDPGNDKARVSSGVDKDYSNVKLGDEIKWQGKSYTLIDDENEEGSLIFRPTEMVTDDAFDGYGDASDDIYLDRSQLKPKSSEPTKDKSKRDVYGDYVLGKMKPEEGIIKGMSKYNMDAYEQVEDAISMLSPKDIGKKEYEKVKMAYSNFANTGDLTQLDYVVKAINKVTGGNLKIDTTNGKSINVNGHTVSYNKSTGYYDVKDSNGKVKMEAMTSDDGVNFAKREPKDKITAKSNISNPSIVDDISRRYGIDSSDIEEVFVGDHGYEYFYKGDETKSLGFYDDRKGTLTKGIDKSQLKSKPERDPSESDHINYDGVSDFDHTTWYIDGFDTQISRNVDSEGNPLPGYYVQNEDWDMEFDTKADLVKYLRDNEADFQGYDSENDY